jgi:hypothetical protein
VMESEEAGGRKAPGEVEAGEGEGCGGHHACRTLTSDLQ